MSRRSHFRIAAFIGFLGLCPLTSSAASLGHPKVSAKGATGAATQWNLICDPQYVNNGSISTQYDPSLASLFTVVGLAPYSVTELLVQVQAAGKSSIVMGNVNGATGVATFTLPMGATETGFAQVFFNLTGSPPTPATDDDTHMLTFNNISGNQNAIGTFTDFMDPGASNGGIFPTADFYSGFIPDPINPMQTDPFTYSADPTSQNFAGVPTPETAIFAVGTPEPSSAALLAMLAAAGLLRRRRQR